MKYNTQVNLHYYYMEAFMDMKKKTAFITLIILWFSLDLPSLAGMLVFTAGLMPAAYIWRRWGRQTGIMNTA